MMYFDYMDLSNQPASFPIHPSLCSLKRNFNHKLTYAFDMEHV